MSKATKLPIMSTYSTKKNRFLSLILLLGATTVGLAFLDTSPASAATFNANSSTGCDTFRGSFGAATSNWSGYAVWDKAENYSDVWYWENSSWVKRVTGYSSKTASSGILDIRSYPAARRAGYWTATGSHKIGSNPWRNSESSYIYCD